MATNFGFLWHNKGYGHLFAQPLATINSHSGTKVMSISTLSLYSAKHNMVWILAQVTWSFGTTIKYRLIFSFINNL